MGALIPLIVASFMTASVLKRKKKEDEPLPVPNPSDADVMASDLRMRRSLGGETRTSLAGKLSVPRMTMPTLVGV